MKRITVAIDGPAGAGKSTVAKLVAAELGYTLVDTGAIYRSVALLASQQNIKLDDDAALEPLVRHLDIRFDLQQDVNRVLLGNQDVSALIRTPEMSNAASLVSTRPVVRAGLLALQRQLAGQGGAVLEGRDIGTVVCPDAEVKFFLDASVQERAKRRYDELCAKMTHVSFDDVLKDVSARDHQDRNRPIAPLRPANDAILLDSTLMRIQDVVDTIVTRVKAVESLL